MLIGAKRFGRTTIHRYACIISLLFNELIFLQDRVTDHRLGRSIMNIDSVMDGDALQEFLVDLGRKHQEELLEEAALS